MELCQKLCYNRPKMSGRDLGAGSEVVLVDREF